jgi:hypothetical protein
LGLISERLGKKHEPGEYFTKALMMDPTLWCAYEKLCKHAVNVDPTKFFNENHPTM